MKMNSKVYSIAHVAVLLVLGVPALAADDLRIVPLVRDDAVLVTFELPEAYDAELRELVSSGLQTTVTYNVELRLVVPVWADRTVVSAVVSTTSRYDSLTGRYSLVRTIDGRVVQALVTQDEVVVREWLTVQSRLPLCSTSLLEPNRDYYVRVGARGRPRSGSLLGRVQGAISGQAKFTFVP
jgi:hypothetical protein